MLIQKIRNFVRKKDGSILVESALFMPILASLVLLSVETSRYLLLNQKLSRSVAVVGDLMSRVEDPENQVGDIMNIVGQIMQPFDIGENSIMITSVLTKPAGENAEIVWQATGAGDAGNASQIGAEGAVPSMPNGFVLRDNETILSTEFFYHYEPLFNFKFWTDKDLYFRNFNKPRLQNLTVLEN